MEKWTKKVNLTKDSAPEILKEAQKAGLEVDEKEPFSHIHAPKPGDHRFQS